MSTRTEIADRVSSHLRPNATYGWAVAHGYQCLSGADLAGKARDYGHSYRAMREQVADLWMSEGGHVRRRKQGGRLTLEPGSPPTGATQRFCSVGECWSY